MAKLEDVKELRDLTGARLVECKKALDATGNDMEKAFDLIIENDLVNPAEAYHRPTKEELDAQARYKQEFLACNNLKDYEQYFLKYRDCKENPFVVEAKKAIQSHSLVTMPYRIIACLLCWVVSGLLILIAFQFDGTTNEYLGILGFFLIVGAFAAFFFGIYHLFNPTYISDIIKQFRNG